MHRSRVLFQMWIIWKIDTVILFKSNMTEKDICCAHKFCSLDCNFFLVWTFYTVDDSWRCKEILNKALSKQSKQLLLFYFLWVEGLSFKTQFKIEFWPPVNRDQLVLEKKGNVYKQSTSQKKRKEKANS